MDYPRNDKVGSEEKHRVEGNGCRESGSNVDEKIEMAGTCDSGRGDPHSQVSMRSVDGEKR